MSHRFFTYIFVHADPPLYSRLSGDNSFIWSKLSLTNNISFCNFFPRMSPSCQDGCLIFHYFDRMLSIPLWIGLLTGSSPICPLQYYFLVHIKNNSYFVGIGPIHDIDLIFFFGLFLLFVRWIKDRSEYYKINFWYISIFKFCYNDI